MQSSASADKQKLLLQQEIAKLSGQISRHASPLNTNHHPYSSSRYPQRGRPSRGRGRGANRSLVLRGQTTQPSIISSAEDSDRTQKWNSSVSASGNLTLVSSETSIRTRPRKPRVPPAAAKLDTYTGKRVNIDGVVFQFTPDGRRLSRVDDSSALISQGTPTRKNFSYGGIKFRRTSRGNLVQSRKSATNCLYYTKTGRCSRGLDCPYSHNPDRLAICPKFLRSACPLTSDTCPLSHSPSAHNTPSCVHFQAFSSCRNGTSCIYPHIKVAPDAPVCEAFARGGWCEKDPGTCPDLHAWECQEYREKGTCSRGGKCGLRHIHRAENDKAIHHPQEGEGSFEENTDYVNLDVGSPPPFQEEEQEDGSESESDSIAESGGSVDEELGIVI